MRQQHKKRFPKFCIGFFTVIIVGVFIIQQSKVTKKEQENIQQGSIFVTHIPKQKISEQYYNRSQKLSLIRNEYMKNHTNYYDSIQSSMFVVIIQNQKFSSSNTDCLVINANENTDYQQQEFKSHLELSKVVRKSIWYFSNEISRNKFTSNSLIKKNKYSEFIYQIDASYNFILSPTQECQKIIFANINHKFLSPNISYPTHCEQILLFYSPPTNLEQSNDQLYEKPLHDLDETFIKSYLLIANRKLLQIITPLNFAFQNIYTWTHLISYPLLGALFNSPKIKKLQKYEHSVSFKSSNETEFQLLRLPIKRKHICFVNYPYNLKMNNLTDYSEFMNFFREYKENNISIITTLVLDETLWQYIEIALSLRAQGINFRLRFREQRIRTTLQIYEASFSYCPSSSTIVSSRHNIIFLKTVFQKQLTNGLCVAGKKVPRSISYYLIPEALTNSQDQVKILQKFTYHDDFRKSFHSQPHYTHAQFFCEQLFRTINITFIKSRQTDFYEAETAFMYLFIETCQNKFKTINQSMFKLKYYHGPSKIQQQESQSLPERIYARKIRKNNRLQPSIYNSLNNKAYKRNAPEVVPRIIHQIYLSSNPLSKLQKTLTKSLLNKHPGFKYHLWTRKDITRENFPHIYDMLSILLKYDEASDVNFMASAAGMMRIQILYQYGGIYIDMKNEGKRSLVPYLKFQQLFLYMAYSELDLDHQQIMKALNGVLISVPGSLHYKLIMEKFYRPQFFQVYFDNPTFTMVMASGGLALKNAYTQKQIITQTNWGEDFMRKLIPAGPCHLLSEFQPEDQPFTINYQLVIGSEMQKQQKVNSIIVPCNYDNDKYLQMYFELASTYLKKKNTFN